MLYILLGLGLLGMGLFLAWFFRDPHRDIILNEDTILAAADGTIIYVEQDAEHIKIATRMSPFNVHLNRAPISGTVTNIQHSPGKHKSVYFAGAEEKNERNLIEMENKSMYCRILQLTGAFANRIECWVELKQNTVQGQKIGIIRFGSQTNVEIRLKSSNNVLKVAVQEGDRVKAGLTVLAKIVGD
jgi:phosphatidylserine decarboxylase